VNDEFEWIKKITPSSTHQPSLVMGIGDDAALYRGNSEFEEIVCMDTMVEEVHFSKKTMKPFHIGYKVLAANISDIAAMGGQPLFYVVSIAIPPTWKENDLVSIYEGMALLAAEFKMDLIGGDTVSTKEQLVITVTVMGRVRKNTHLLRKNAKPGDIVFVTEYAGKSAAGLSLLLNNGLDHPYTELENQLIQAHQMPYPQIEAGRILSEKNLRVSLNDISDGLASEAYEIAEASAVSLVIDYDKIPKSKALNHFPEHQQQEWILYGGEDFQLIGTTDKEAWEEIQPQFKQAKLRITEIGEVENGPVSVKLVQNGQCRPIEKKGYNHFRR
jgi:thiamine-monophosphate kinase